jgi:hypothetical protein
MPKSRKTKAPTSASLILKGWQQIAEFLGQPINVAQRWGRTGMPITRQGRNVVATPAELNRWLGREAGGEPVHVATEGDDLAAELKRGLAFVRKQKLPDNAAKKARYASTNISTEPKRFRGIHE